MAISIDVIVRELALIVGEQWVFTTEEDRSAYADHFDPDEEKHRPLGAVSPANTEEIQAILRVANAHSLPLWPISRGKNFGYGGPAPVKPDSFVLDLSRMRAISVDVDAGTVLIEPGVSFYDLYEHIEKIGARLWLSVPSNSWGSVVGNALDRGVGYTPYGDHSSRICGMEVMLPDGDLVRTGMGAVTGSDNWQLYRYGFGPAWDQVFCQSNFGIVTKMGLWLMPEPEAMLGISYEVDKPEDLEWLVDAIAPFRRNGLLAQAPSIGNWLRAAAGSTTRSEWFDQPNKPLPDSVITAIRRKFNIGWWGVSMRLYGYQDVNSAAAREIEKAFNGRSVLSVRKSEWHRGQPKEQTIWAGVPVTAAMQNANWHGGRGGHLGFSPVLPFNGAKAMAQFRRSYQRYQEYAMDYHGSFSMGERHITNVNQILFDKDDEVMTGRLDQFFRTLVADAKAHGYSEYRTHIDYMDLVASTYDFNDGALARLNRRVKDALDPKGILAPGKSGIWPPSDKGDSNEAFRSGAICGLAGDIHCSDRPCHCR